MSGTPDDNLYRALKPESMSSCVSSAGVGLGCRSLPARMRIGRRVGIRIHKRGMDVDLLRKPWMNESGAWKRLSLTDANNALPTAMSRSVFAHATSYRLTLLAPAIVAHRSTIAIRLCSRFFSVYQRLCLSAASRA